MNVLLVSNAEDAFNAQSALGRRLRAYAAELGQLQVLSAAPPHAREEADGPLRLLPVRGRGLLRLATLLWRARRILGREGIEVVSAQDPFEYGLIAWTAALFTETRLHLQLHTDPFTPAFARMSFANRIRTWVMPFVLRRAGRIRVVAPALKSSMVRRYRIAPERVSIVPIYADLARFRALRRTPEKGLLLWIGRFEREKDPTLALEAFAAAHARGAASKLVMLGAGRLEGALRARAAELGLAPRVEFPGWRDPMPYLARAELVLATSRYEGYGLAIVEARAAGVPVLSTDAGVARSAGALVATRGEYPFKAADLLARGIPPASPIADPYPSFEAYVAAYAEDLRQT